MPIQRLIGVAALVSMLLFVTPSHAETRAVANLPLVAGGISSSASPLSLNQLPILNPSPMFGAPGTPGFAGAGAFGAGHGVLAPVAVAPARADDAKSVAGPVDEQADGSAETITDLRKALITLAMHLRDVRYVRGGHSPATGFDCSGFVRYVFAHAIGVQLPTNSASQFLAGLKVKRADMKPGDLVFFHTGGRRHRVTHVGIYISNGRFIHAPTTGKSVQISSLDEAYWAKRFVGAKRPEGMLALARNG
ncbi:C40 family peptidase [Rhodanobacter aciditrophus]|uniref:C40 family peptidase n=1 Tax=Rhodanobacter aciditrophus TaxID=1623218 RepID=UPI003CF65107